MLHVVRISLLVLLMSVLHAVAQCPQLVWSDEFDGDAVNEANWSYQNGGSGWGNNELQYYQPENATVSNGVLKITAKEEVVGGRQYTSTRMRSIGKADFTYGRFEARIKMTQGQGIWPAFWMMPTDNTYGTWPRSGEIDIMENVGHEKATTHGTIHFGNSGHVYSGNSFVLAGGKQLSDDFHVFAVEKTPNEIRWYVDDILFFTRTPDDIAPEFWPFEARFHFILNLAVGGNWPGNPDDTTIFPQVLEVDYVRVYDLGKRSVEGEREVPNRAMGKTYQVNKAPPGSFYTWTVPEGATITGGQNTSCIYVDWGDTGGVVTCTLNGPCGPDEVSMEVFVNPPTDREFSFENFDEPENVVVANTTGTLTEIANPDTTGINPSALVGNYVRSDQDQYDVIAYSTTAIPNADIYANSDRVFSIDIYTTAPPGTPILLQLENSSVALPFNYPFGRHSRYQVQTSVQHAWQRLEVPFLDRPDGGTAASSVDSLIVLFAPDSFTNDTWIFDNLDSYRVQVANPVPATALCINQVVTETVGRGKGHKLGCARVRVVDNNGRPVTGARVTGNFSGDYIATSFGITGEDGTVLVQAGITRRGQVTFSFCVTDVQHPILTYNAAANIVTCRNR